MRMPRFRFTIRRMMIVVAVAIAWAGLWVGNLARLRLIYLERATYYDGEFRVNDYQARNFERAHVERPREYFDVYAAQRRERADWARILKAKYERATRYPWLPVEPDPPEPSE
jgi:hypothetical protein